MSRRRRIYDGKAKTMFEGPEPGTLIQYFKDDATAFNAQKREILSGKGVLNNRISAYLMTKLADIGIPTAFIRRLNMREQLVREVEIIPPGRFGELRERRLGRIRLGRIGRDRGDGLGFLPRLDPGQQRLELGRLRFLLRVLPRNPVIDAFRHQHDPDDRGEHQPAIAPPEGGHAVAAIVLINFAKDF